jgi:hypothetical protein
MFNKPAIGCSTNRPLFHNSHSYEYGHILLYYLSPTWMFNEPTSEALGAGENSKFGILTIWEKFWCKFVNIKNLLKFGHRPLSKAKPFLLDETFLLRLELSDFQNCSVFKPLFSNSIWPNQGHILCIYQWDKILCIYQCDDISFRQSHLNKKLKQASRLGILNNFIE